MIQGLKLRASGFGLVLSRLQKDPFHDFFVSLIELLFFHLAHLRNPQDDKSFGSGADIRVKDSTQGYVEKVLHKKGRKEGMDHPGR